MCKKKFMLFCSTSHLNVRYRNSVFESVKTFKYLGLHLDSDVKFEHHNKHLCGKLSSICGLLRKISYFILHALRKSLFYLHREKRIKKIIKTM